MSSDVLSGAQFGDEGPFADRKQFVMMRPSELAPFAHDRSDKFAQSKVNAIAASIQRRGYRASKHDNPHRLSDSHIRLHYSDGYQSGGDLVEGNHRVAAMRQIGYDRPVRVRVTDDRTKT